MMPQFELIARGTSVRYVETRSIFNATELDAFLEKCQCNEVSINQAFGRGQSDLDEALQSKKTKRLSVVLESATLSRLADNRTVERFYLSGALAKSFDFSLARGIRSLALQWSGNILGLPEMTWLEELSLRKFRGDEACLDSLNFLTGLRLIEPSIVSVEFLRAFTRLQKLEISYARSLANLQGLSSLKGGLRELELDHLPRISPYEPVISGLVKLKVLKLTKCPPLKNLEFIRKLPEIEFFSFVDTDVLSGDLSPCRGLSYVGFLDKGSYNYTWNNKEKRLEPKVTQKAKSS